MTTGVIHTDLENKEYVGWTRFLREAESWSRAEIEGFQLAEVRRVVRHAWDHAPGYRRLYEDAGVDPDTIASLDDLRRLPTIDKETIRDRLEAFSVPEPDREYITTGGSTGIPFGFYRTPRAFARELASKAHQYYRVGWLEGDRQLVLRGLPIDSPDHIRYFPEFNELRCSSYHLVPEWMERFRLAAIDYQPAWIRCYPSSGHLFGRFLKETGRPFPPVKGILCASENLYPFQKKLMTDVFRARVFSHYGHYELAVLAGFCEYKDTYHVLPQYGHAELIGPDGRPVTQRGEMGEIVATSFLMTATPFIRYRTRDFAVLKGRECRTCGRPYGLWSRIEGRLQEFIVTGTGRRISMTALDVHDDIFDRIARFQFHQRERGRVTFRYVPKEKGRAADLGDVRRRLAAKLGDDTKIVFERVDRIDPTVRGKHRFLVQELELESGES